MHIVFFTHQFLPKHIGGTEVYTLGLAKRVMAAGHSATVVTYQETDSGNPADCGPVFKTYDGIPVVEIVYNVGLALNPARYEYDNQFVANILRHILPRMKPSLVHVIHAMKLSAAALEVCDELGIPFIVTLCDFWFICPRHTLLKWDQKLCQGPSHVLACTQCVRALHGFAQGPHLVRDLFAISRRNTQVRRALLKARHIIALSDFQMRMYSRNGIPAERIELIAHGLDLADATQPSVYDPKRPPRITYIGSLVEHKGLHILIEALASLPDAQLECNVYGALEPGTPYISRLRQKAADDPRIHFRGLFSPEELGHIVGRTDILAVPSLWYENDPLVVKAALRSGVPVLASDIGSLAEMITHGQHGWLVKPADPFAWAEALRMALGVYPDFTMEPVKVKTIDENAAEMMALYAEASR